MAKPGLAIGKTSGLLADVKRVIRGKKSMHVTIWCSKNFFGDQNLRNSFRLSQTSRDHHQLWKVLQVEKLSTLIYN